MATVKTQYYNSTNKLYEDNYGSNNSMFVSAPIIGPTLIDSVLYSSFTANGAVWNPYVKKLTRNAKKRTFIIVNNLNVALTSLNIFITDSYANSSGGNNSGASHYTLPQNVNSTSTLNIGSDTTAALGLAGDTFQIGVGIGATAPTSGSVLIYVLEIL